MSMLLLDRVMFCVRMQYLPNELQPKTIDGANESEKVERNQSFVLTNLAL